MKPIYSICICNYNMSKFLDISIESICSQLDNQFEIVFLDDGSTDDSLLKIYKLKEKYKFINIYKLKRDSKRRLGFTRNESINYARGTYVLTHIDCDDFYENYIKNLIKIFHIIERYNNNQEFHLSAKHINITTKKFAQKNGPYRNIFYTEDRDMWRRIAAQNKLILLEHYDFVKRISLPTKRRILKTLQYVYKISSQYFETDGNLKDFIVNEILNPRASFLLRTYKLLILLPCYIYGKYISDYELDNRHAPILNDKEWQLYKKMNTYTLESFIKKNNIDINSLELDENDKRVFLNKKN